MSQGQKLIERPKVRFCQLSDDSSTNSNNAAEKAEGLFQTTSRKPRIRSIVTLEEPFKLIFKNGDLRGSSKTNTEITNAQCLSKPVCASQPTSDLTLKKSSSSSHNTHSKKLGKPCVPEIQHLPKTQESLLLCDKSQSNNIRDNNASCSTMPPSGTENCMGNKPQPCTSNLKNTESTTRITTCQRKSKHFISSEPGVPVKNTNRAMPNMSTNSGIRISKVESDRATLETASCEMQKVEKQSVVASNENVTAPKNAICKSNVSSLKRQNEKTSGKVLPCSGRTNMRTVKSIPCGLKSSKPGTKIWKTRTKSSPVKKTILRDVNVHATNVEIGPGVARYYPQPFKMRLEKQLPHVRQDNVSGEKLSRPEYNSIMCTIDELKKAQAEKFITDVEHLPLVYRNLVNGKVSAALDFQPDEAIYKNLIDLSINVNQLPSRLTRSKDPEPRHRDIIPKLSDFFTPSYSEEYCTAIQIRPGSAEISSNWSAFAISDKIFGWKHDMDQCC